MKIRLLHYLVLQFLCGVSCIRQQVTLQKELDILTTYSCISHKRMALLRQTEG